MIRNRGLEGWFRQSSPGQDSSRSCIFIIVLERREIYTIFVTRSWLSFFYKAVDLHRSFFLMANQNIFLFVYFLILPNFHCFLRDKVIKNILRSQKSSKFRYFREVIEFARSKTVYSTYSAEACKFRHFKDLPRSELESTLRVVPTVSSALIPFRLILKSGVIYELIWLSKIRLWKQFRNDIRDPEIFILICISRAAQGMNKGQPLIQKSLKRKFWQMAKIRIEIF